MSNIVVQRQLAEQLKRLVQSSQKELRGELDTKTNYLFIGKQAIRQMVELEPRFRSRPDLEEFVNSIYTYLKVFANAEMASRKDVRWSRDFRDMIEFPASKNQAGGDVNVVASRVRPFIHSIKKKVFKNRSPRLQPLRMFLFGSASVEEQERQLSESSGQFVHFGHTLGQAAKNADLVQSNPAFNFQDLKEFSDLSKTEFTALKRTLKSVVKIDANLKIVKKIGPKSQKVVGVLELAANNLSTGGKTGNIVKNIIDTLASRIDIVGMESSKSAIKAIDDMVVDAFMDRPSKVYKKTSKGKATEKIIRTSKAVQLKAAKSTIRKTSSAKLPDLLTLTRQINAAMHDTLKQDVMGKGGAHELLNYRTGRFAESVKVRRLIPSQTGKSMSADVTYMKNPYMVFSPVGGLYKPLRNPTTLAGRAIRIIMKDLAIQGLSLREVREV